MKVAIVNPIMCSSNSRGLLKWNKLIIERDDEFSTVQLKKALDKFADTRIFSSDFYRPRIESKHVTYCKTSKLFSPIIAPFFNPNVKEFDKVICVDFLQPATLKLLKKRRVYVWQDLNHYPKYSFIFKLLRFIYSRRFKNIIMFVPKTDSAKKFLLINGFKKIGPVIGGGVNFDKFKNLNLKEKFVLSVGRLSKEKGHANLIKAMYGLGKKLVIVGEGPEKESLRKLALKLNVDVEFKGLVNKDELCKLYNQSYFLVLPSLYGETFGFVVLEAFACGKTAIVTDIPGPGDIVNTHLGVKIKSGDVEALNKAIRYLLDNKKIRDKLSKNANIFVKKNYSWDTNAKRFFSLLK